MPFFAVTCIIKQTATHLEKDEYLLSPFISPHWQIMQVQMIKNTICARNFIVHRLILS